MGWGVPLRVMGTPLFLSARNLSGEQVLALLAMTESYVTECLISARAGDTPLFEKTAEGAVIARLRGYAVIPVEDYEALGVPNRTSNGLALRCPRCQRSEMASLLGFVA